MTTKVSIELGKSISTINKNLYGHFAEHLGNCIYDGFWVGLDSDIPNRNGIRIDVVDALKEIDPPVLRWPGGCFADDYHWRDGIGAPGKRPVRVNRWWNSIEPNRFGTHEYMDLCSQLGAEPYVCGNVGSGTVSEMVDWLEYLNHPGGTTLSDERAANGHLAPYNVVYWGVGNENWGCGGNMSPQYYGNEYRRYATYLNHSFHDKPLYKIACGASRLDVKWTRKFFETVSGKTCGCGSAQHLVDGYAVHYYCHSLGNASDFGENDWYAQLLQTIGMEDIITEHRAVMDEFDPHRRIGLICDEWGSWYKPMEGTTREWLRQQNTIRDALVAAITLDIFNTHADKIVMSNIAQTANVLHSMVLTDGKKMHVTPTYHVYRMYKHHQGGLSLPTGIETGEVGGYLSLPNVLGSCSLKDGIITLSLVNASADKEERVAISMAGGGSVTFDEVEILAAEGITAHNTFDEPDRVRPVSRRVSGADIDLPPASVVVLRGKAPA